MDDELKEMIEKDFEDGIISDFDETICIYHEGLNVLEISPYEKKADLWVDPRKNQFRQFRKYITFLEEMGYKVNHCF